MTPELLAADAEYRLLGKPTFHFTIVQPCAPPLSLVVFDRLFFTAFENTHPALAKVRRYDYVVTRLATGTRGFVPVESVRQHFKIEGYPGKEFYEWLITREEMLTLWLHRVRQEHSTR